MLLPHKTYPYKHTTRIPRRFNMEYTWCACKIITSETKMILACILSIIFDSDVILIIHDVIFNLPLFTRFGAL